jgi:TrmH family RNA methyltransferase
LRRLIQRSSVRQSEGAFVAEGLKVVQAALDAGAPVNTIFIAAEGATNPAVTELADEAFKRGARVFDLGPGVMERVADTVTPQPVCAIVGIDDLTLDALLATDGPAAGGRLLLACVEVRDPGNLGAVLRTASASGTSGVVVCAGCVDPYNPKTVRASAGAIFNLPLVRGGEPGEVLRVLGGAGFELVGTTAGGGTDYLEMDLEGDVVLVLGNEASGLPDEVSAMLDRRLTIPMAEGTESLNVAMAAAVLCFEVARRRRQTGPPASAA